MDAEKIAHNKSLMARAAGRKNSFIVLFLFAALLALPGILGAWLPTEALFTTPQPISCSTGGSIDWVPLSFVAILLGFVLQAGVWALSGVLGTTKYQGFMRHGMWGLVECTALLAVLSLSMVGLMEFGLGNINTARAYAVIIRNTVAGDFAMTLGSLIPISFLTNVSPTLRPFSKLPALAISIQVAPMFKPIYDTLGLLLQMMTVSIVQWMAHEFLLCAVKDSMLTMLLPAGLFLRAYGFKSGGNALIGLALSLYFVYPYMINQIGQIVSEYVQTDTGARPIICVPSAAAAGGELSIPNGGSNISVSKVLNGPIWFNFQQGPSVGTGCAYNTMLGSVYRVFSDSVGGLDIGSGLGAAGITGVIYILAKTHNLQFLSLALLQPATVLVQMIAYETVYFMFIVSIVLPIFTIFICITLAKEIAKVLGTEIDLSALEKII